MSFDVITKSLDKLDGNIHAIKTSQAELQDRIQTLEQSGPSIKAMNQGAGAEGTLGALVAAEFRKNEESFKRHKTLSMELSTKSIQASLVGARSSLAPTPGGDVQVVTQLLPKLQMTGSGGVAAMIYPRRQTTITGPGASAVAENATRTQSQPLYVSITQPFVTVAGYAELSESAIRTTGELERVTNLHLAADVFRATDDLLIQGGTNFTGGLLTVATADVLPLAGTNDLLEEFIAIEAMKMRAAGYQPNIVVVSPADWQDVYLRRETTTGAYIHASPLSTAPLSISGCSVVFAAAGMTAKTAMLIDSRFVDFMPSGTMRVEMAYVASQFLTGEITMRCELQGIPVVRDLNAIKLVSRASA